MTTVEIELVLAYLHFLFSKDLKFTAFFFYILYSSLFSIEIKKKNLDGIQTSQASNIVIISLWESFLNPTIVLSWRIYQICQSLEQKGFSSHIDH